MGQDTYFIRKSTLNIKDNSREGNK